MRCHHHQHLRQQQSCRRRDPRRLVRRAWRDTHTPHHRTIQRKRKGPFICDIKIEPWPVNCEPINAPLSGSKRNDGIVDKPVKSPPNTSPNSMPNGVNSNNSIITIINNNNNNINNINNINNSSRTSSIHPWCVSFLFAGTKKKQIICCLPSSVPVSLSGASPSLLDGALTVPSSPPPPSTGSGEDVEHTKDLMRAVEQLASGAAGGGAAAAAGKSSLDRWENMTQWSEDLVQRAQALFPESGAAGSNSRSNSSSHSSSPCGEPETETTTIITTEQPLSLSLLQSKCRELEARIQELATCRDEANASEHKVRRGLYRLATGRMTLDEVIKAVELDSDGKLLMESEVEQNASSLPVVKKEEHNNNDDVKMDGATAEQMAELQKQVRTLEEVSQSRDEQITKLLEEREQWMKRMNELLVVQRRSDENNGGGSVVEDADMIRQSRVYTETAAKVVTAERQIEQLQTLCDKLKQNWAESRGNEALLKEALKDLHEKHVKRWNELELSNNTDNTSSSAGGESSSKETTTCSPNGTTNGPKSAAKQVVELEHELQQALETVRQAETIRTSLHEALKMNESLQSKLEELRAKNAALVAGKSASRASLSTGGSGGGTTGTGGSSAGANATGTEQSHSHHHKEKVSSSSHSASTSERMQEKHRRMRKELMSAQLSKEAAKSKQDVGPGSELRRAEKERDALLKTNARLLNQISEKDDMNAKSLSTILHLKSLAEQLTQEKDILDQKSKSSAQLALAARLASNAKERLEEEVLREKKISEETLEEREERINAIQAEVDLAESRVSQSAQKMVVMVKDLEVAKQRCDELVAESTEWEKDKKTLVESLAVARRETSEAKKRAAASSANGTSSHGESQFS
eukprot:scaffold22602_cov44-Attheya_sp.AAC.1